MLNVLIFFLLQAISAGGNMSGGNLGGLASSFKGAAYPYIMMGFGFAGLAVLKMLVSKEENAGKALKAYIVAIIVFASIWNFI